MLYEVITIGTDAFQEVDIYGISIPITKHNYLIRSVDELHTVIPEAFRMASTGRPGPILIDIPKDVQNSITSYDPEEQYGFFDQLQAPSLPTVEKIELAADMINNSKRPVFRITSYNVCYTKLLRAFLHRFWSFPFLQEGF